MTETGRHLAVPEPPVVRPSRPATVLGRLAHALRERNWGAAAIDSLLHHPDAIAPERVPPLFYILDHYAFSEYDFDQARLDRGFVYLEFAPDDEDCYRLADDVRRFMDVPMTGRDPARRSVSSMS